jgi:hypothetical protein
MPIHVIVIERDNTGKAGTAGTGIWILTIIITIMLTEVRKVVGSMQRQQILPPSLCTFHSCPTLYLRETVFKNARNQEQRTLN